CFRLAILVLSLTALIMPSLSQLQPLHYDEGVTGLGLALRKLSTTGSLLHITAHPDDEDNPLLVMLSRGRGIRTGLLTLTRGEGGQNEIGPELFEALGLIRTGELMAIHRYDGAEQFFSRAYEFGYSYSVEETFEKWGKEEILSDVVRIIRRYRPAVISTLPRSGEGGGQHHPASAQIALEAYHAAGDPSRFPEQIQEGLRPWQAKKIYERVGWGGGNPGTSGSVLSVDCGDYDPLLGATYQTVGLMARSMHRCQGMSQVPPLPRPYASRWHLIDSKVSATAPESDLFDGIETTLISLGSRLGSQTE